MGLKVCIVPALTGADKADGGIRRVLEAQHKYLPEYGVELVNDPKQADIVNCHAGNLVDLPGIPMISSNHGLYWENYDWGNWAHEANKGIVQAFTCARAITAPSHWVAQAISRGFLYRPKVIHHGVETDEWLPGHSEGYVLWNKARSDMVSNPADMETLASRMPKQQFVTTIISPSAYLKNVQVTGVMSVNAMKELVRHAAVQLVTTRETFGILTIEALSCGVPVAGWDYAGQHEIVKQGETGYLAPLGDYEALRECVERCLAERERLSANARQDAVERWRWPDKIARYAALYQDVADENDGREPKVTVVVPCYNMEPYLAQCLRSVQAQTTKDWECVVVDDCSTDGSSAIAREFVEKDDRFDYVKTERNLGLCEVRNYGIQLSAGKYIMFLDGDDLLTPVALAHLAETLDNESGIQIAYGHLDVTNEAATSVALNDWPFAKFSWYGQIAHLNQLPYNALVRRDVYERGGGFRKRHWRAEDAWYWAFATSFGIMAEKATDAPLLVWRSRASGKSIQERQRNADGDGDWTAEFPWAIAHSADVAMTMLQGVGWKVPNGSLVPFGAQGPPPEGDFWNIRHHNAPETAIEVDATGIDVVKDWQTLIDTLDSLILSEATDWECVVRTEQDVAGIPGAPWAYVARPGASYPGAPRDSVKKTVTITPGRVLRSVAKLEI